MEKNRTTVILDSICMEWLEKEKLTKGISFNFNINKVLKEHIEKLKK